MHHVNGKRILKNEIEAERADAERRVEHNDVVGVLPLHGPALLVVVELRQQYGDEGGDRVGDARDNG